MKNRLLKIACLLTTVLILFTSCGVKEYAGFSVKNKSIIEIPEGDESVLLMPLELYKSLEQNLVKFAEQYNYFANITEDDFTFYKNLTMDIYSLELKDAVSDPEGAKVTLSKIVKDEKAVDSVLKSLSKMESDSVNKIDLFTKTLSDNFDILIYTAGEIKDFDKDGAPWYETRKALFEDASNDETEKLAKSFMEKYFPAVKFVLTYEETGFALGNN